MSKNNTKWTRESVLSVIKECRLAGSQAAQETLARLQQHGPSYIVKDASGTPVDTMLDVCGFAWLEIPARGRFYTLAKQLSLVDSNRVHCVRAYRGGGHLSIYDCSNRQELSVNKAANAAMANVLMSHGVVAIVKSRID